MSGLRVLRAARDSNPNGQIRRLVVSVQPVRLSAVGAAQVRCQIQLKGVARLGIRFSVGCALIIPEIIQTTGATGGEAVVEASGDAGMVQEPAERSGSP
jgi:hypothetical protein